MSEVERGQHGSGWKWMGSLIAGKVLMRGVLRGVQSLRPSRGGTPVITSQVFLIILLGHDIHL